MRSLFDSFELVRQQGLPAAALTGDANATTAETATQYLREHGRSVIGSIGGSVKEGDAFFLSACLKHVLPRSQRVDGRAWVPLVRRHTLPGGPPARDLRSDPTRARAGRRLVLQQNDRRGHPRGGFVLRGGRPALRRLPLLSARAENE